MNFAIIDVETTGGSPEFDKITEIAILIHDGEKVVDEYSTLINPERAIPPFITNLTGITNEMVADAPKFFEVARDIVERLQDKIFVAHNVGFDYHFIRNEFKQLGYAFKKPQLCTVKLSRKLIPGLSSYSLGNLCSELGILIENRHRASGDAQATAKLFEILLGLNEANRTTPSLFRSQSLSNLNPKLNLSRVEQVPEETGVYYFYNELGDIIYIGKSTNLYQRVISHLRNTASRKAMKMRDEIADIDVETTGSELIALLKESEEIKQIKPSYNRAQRRSASNFGIHSEKDEEGYIRFRIERDREGSEPCATYSTLAEARKHLERLVDKYQLCQKMAGLYEVKGACFQRQIGSCYGACTGEESPASYNLRAERAKMSFEFSHRNFFILDKGRNEQEYAVIKIDGGKYRGFGYVTPQPGTDMMELLHDCIHPYTDNRDVQQIIRNYLFRHQVKRILPY
jgi:DNA polymerase-3 subunit epsilon